jgi:flagellin-specific chaperone FliS
MIEREIKMKTAEQIIAYLEAELNEAIELHDEAKENKDFAQAHATLLKAYTISELLDEIKEG